MAYPLKILQASHKPALPKPPDHLPQLGFGTVQIDIMPELEHRGCLMNAGLIRIDFPGMQVEQIAAFLVQDGPNAGTEYHIRYEPEVAATRKGKDHRL
jgi:hypothetical protein